MEVLIQKIQELARAEAFEYELFGNTLGGFLFAAAAFLVFLVILKFIQWAVLNRLKGFAERTKTDLDDTLIRIVKTIRPPFYSFLAFYLAVTIFLSLSPLVLRGITVILVVWIAYQAIGALQILIDYVVKKSLGGKDDDTKAAAGLIGKIAKITLWAIGLLLILSNLGVNVNSLIAGLGIGGVAIAFALQNILADLFSSFAIYFDKPFLVGDFIVVGSDMGTVERIGIKTTRIRSMKGEELVISNQELTSARIQNFKKIGERRVSFRFGVLYETPTDKLREIPRIIGKIIGELDSAKIDRVHFTSFDDSALTFEVVYLVNSPEYLDYMNTQQEINFKIKEEFEKRGIEMAYPTQTIYIAGNNG